MDELCIVKQDTFEHNRHRVTSIKVLATTVLSDAGIAVGSHNEVLIGGVVIPDEHRIDVGKRLVHGA